MCRSRGFTLTELLVVLAIMAILAAIGYPSYQGYTNTARDGAAKQFLLDIANDEEQYRLDARTYTSELAALNLTVPENVAGAYTVSIIADATTFTLTATPASSSLSTITLNHLGQKTPVGW